MVDKAIEDKMTVKTATNAASTLMVHTHGQSVHSTQTASTSIGRGVTTNLPNRTIMVTEAMTDTTMEDKATVSNSRTQATIATTIRSGTIGAIKCYCFVTSSSASFEKCYVGCHNVVDQVTLNIHTNNFFSQCLLSELFLNHSTVQPTEKFYSK